ncbi:MAG: DUF1460 domain-containing protein [Bacteroidia bacterium]|nr:DUF1460 domain-containing protein [Bacteroidia bacterium]
MKSIQVLVIILFFPIILDAQVVCTLKDKQLATGHLKALRAVSQPPASIGDKVVLVGKRFLGTHYVAKTLETGMDEQLVINQRELDCTTFLENVVVMSALWEENKYDFQDFQNGIEYLRYRDGKRLDYPSRLHYFSEWIANNEKKGILKDITKEIGGRKFDKTINFMSTHRSAYKQLSNPTYWEEIKAIEAKLAQREMYYIPKSEVAKVEGKIKDGDLIALTTSIKALDIVHVGFAYHKNGRLHFLHASTGSNRVEISKKPLVEYMQGIKSQSGIMVARLNER